MKRQTLQDMGLTAEQVDKIMELNGVDIEKYISRYAKTSYAEAFAEAFADRRDRAFNRFFKEELDKVLKETFKK